MDEINKLKRKIYNGENIAANYSQLMNLVNKRKKLLEKISNKLKKPIETELECDDEKEIEADELELSKMKKFDSDYINLYRNILAKINYLEHHYENNVAVIKKIEKNNNKISFKLLAD